MKSSWQVCYAQESSPRGLATFALLNRKYPVRDAGEVLSVSRAPAFAFVHKIFGNEYQNVAELIDYIDTHSLKPYPPITVIVYLDCGPCRPPRRPPGFARILAPRLNISQLNRALARKNDRIVEAFTRELDLILSKLPERPNVKYIIIPSLEDNLTPKAWATMAQVTLSRIGGRVGYSLARNSLPNAYRRVITTEVHGYNTSFQHRLKPGDIVNGDGENICFPGERCEGKPVWFVKEWLQSARSKGLIALIWRPETQGLDLSGKSIPIADRKYRIPNKNILKDLLTYGD